MSFLQTFEFSTSMDGHIGTWRKYNYNDVYMMLNGVIQIYINPAFPFRNQGVKCAFEF